MDEKMNVAVEQQKQDAKKREAPLSVRSDPETIAKFDEIAAECFPNERDAKKKAMRLIVDSYDLSRLPKEVPSVAMQTENFNTAVATISDSFLQVVQEMVEYEENIKKAAEEDVAEAVAERDRMTEELAEARKSKNVAVEERDEAVHACEQAQELAKVKTELVDTLQAQVRDLQGQVDRLERQVAELQASGEGQESLVKEMQSLREFIGSRSWLDDPDSAGNREQGQDTAR